MTVSGPIVRSDPNRLMAWALVPVDDRVEDAVYKFVSSEWGTVVESMFLSSEKLSMLGIGGEPSWVIALQLSASEWARFEAGEFNGVRVQIEDEVSPSEVPAWTT